MIQKYWYRIYVALIALLSVVIIASSFIQTQPSVTQTGITSTSMQPLAFYTPNIPLSAQDFMKDWFSRHNVSDTALANMTVRSGSYNEKSYRLAGILYRDINFYLDIKNPSVSYKVYVQANLNTNEAPLVYITCPDASNQRGTAANCQGMTQI